MKRKASNITSSPIRKQMRTRPRSYANPPMSRRGLRPEMKNVDNTGITSTTPASNAFAVPRIICNIASGPSPNERVGRKINYKSLQIRGINNTTADVRIIVVYDKQYNKTPPLATDIMTQNIFSGMHNLGNSDRFITIVDEIFKPVDGTVNLTPTFNIYRKLNLESVYSGDTANDCVTGALLFMQADPTTAATSVTFTVRAKYTDV